MCGRNPPKIDCVFLSQELVHLCVREGCYKSESPTPKEVGSVCGLPQWHCPTLPEQRTVCSHVSINEQPISR